ncbi:hypothetical protein GYMLUDRAFT_990247 [Collybiopsis luxurians FD-317 M1]|uniref:Uncharacterized protein n=1 Tax=Collybiopsis luxurians FD-317 M1 TaxID=944289 RepID=A0A0D0CTL3_9AGAR|nr:hypothetical protein GYMLUDRAFT_990247 [Collybiopsis luxurians FD-317 M1]
MIGIYSVLIPVSSYIMIRRGLATRARKILFGMTIFMYLLSTVYWIASISTLIQLIQAWFLSPDPDARSAPNYLPFFNALSLVNYILTDAVVIWRAWVLCSADGKAALGVCLFMFFLANISVTATIGIRIAMMIINTQTGLLFSRLTHGINVTQVATLVMSVLTNSLATSLISIKAWKSRAEIREDLDAAGDTRARAGKVFALLIETGVLYSLSCITVLISTVIPLKEGTLGDLYTPVNTQLAGIYPVAVLLLVTENRSVDKTIKVFASGANQSSYRSATRQLESMRFERRSVMSIGSDISEVDSYLDGHTGGLKKQGQSFLPPIPSATITWGDVRENV